MNVVEPTVSVLIAWRNRREIGRALRQNANTLNAIGAEVLIVNGGGDREVLRELTRDTACRTVRLIDMRMGRLFNKPECLNIGGYVSRAACLFVLDADIVLGEGFLDRAVDAVTQGGCFVSLGEVIESNPELSEEFSPHAAFIRQRVITTEFTRPDGGYASIEYRMSTDGRRSGPGMVLVRREHFTAVQGFNSRLRGWGFEDNDLQIRLQLGLGLRRQTFGHAFHLSHAPVRHARRMNARNTITCTENYARGEWQGTLDADITRWRGRATARAAEPYDRPARSA